MKLEPGTYTAYAILEYVITLVEKEPRRLNMRTWVRAFKGLFVYKCDDPPPCNTVACLAGWINIAVGKELHEDGSEDGLNWEQFDDTHAIEALGLRGSAVSWALKGLFGSWTLDKDVAVEKLRRIMDNYRDDLQGMVVVS